jgi:NAD+ synthase (glutamine-hydrolysing)
MIFMNGALYKQASQFSVTDVEVITATLNLDEVRSARASVPSRSMQAASCKRLPRVKVDFFMTHSENESYSIIPNPPIKPQYLLPEEEIAYGNKMYVYFYPNIIINV